MALFSMIIISLGMSGESADYSYCISLYFISEERLRDGAKCLDRDRRPVKVLSSGYCRSRDPLTDLDWIM